MQYCIPFPSDRASATCTCFVKLKFANWNQSMFTGLTVALKPFTMKFWMQYCIPFPKTIPFPSSCFIHVEPQLGLVSIEMFSFNHMLLLPILTLLNRVFNLKHRKQMSPITQLRQPVCELQLSPLTWKPVFQDSEQF